MPECGVPPDSEHQASVHRVSCIMKTHAPVDGLMCPVFTRQLLCHHQTNYADCQRFLWQMGRLAWVMAPDPANTFRRRVPPLMFVVFRSRHHWGYVQRTLPTLRWRTQRFFHLEQLSQHVYQVRMIIHSLPGHPAPVYQPHSCCCFNVGCFFPDMWYLLNYRISCIPSVFFHMVTGRKSRGSQWSDISQYE